MFSFFKKKKIVAHLKLSGVIGNAGKFKQGIDFAGQEEIIKKAFSLKKSQMCCNYYKFTRWISCPIPSNLQLYKTASKKK